MGVIEKVCFKVEHLHGVVGGAGWCFIDRLYRGRFLRHDVVIS